VNKQQRTKEQNENQNDKTYKVEKQNKNGRAKMMGDTISLQVRTDEQGEPSRVTQTSSEVCSPLGSGSCPAKTTSPVTKTSDVKGIKQQGTTESGITFLQKSGMYSRCEEWLYAVWQ
jgi:hypothetical protein